MKAFFIILFTGCIVLTSCLTSKTILEDKTESNTMMKNIKSTVEENILSYIESHGMYKRIVCPDYASDVSEGTRLVCFFGSGEMDKFIEFVTPKLEEYSKEQIYWGKDYGLWHAGFKIINSNMEGGILARTKDSSEFTRNDPRMERFDLLIKVLFR